MRHNNFCLKWIDRVIRRHRAAIIILVTTLLIISISLYGRYANAANNIYSARSCQKQTSIRIIDESGGNALFPRSNSSSEDPPFKKYVDTISKHVFDKIDEMVGLSSCDIEVDLFFVYRPLISEGIAPFNFKQIKAKNTKHLDSPWVKLSITNSPSLVIRAAFIWNERQFLLDQVLMSGELVSLKKPLLPFSRNIFERYGDDYANSVMRPLPEEKTSLSQDEIYQQSLEREAAAQVRLSKRLPADLLWMFRKGWQSTRGGLFPDIGALDDTIERVMDKYVDLTKILLNGRFESPIIVQKYLSILNLKDIFNINKYQINSLH
jgi:hypothetical protein